MFAEIDESQQVTPPPNNMPQRCQICIPTSHGIGHKAVRNIVKWK